MLKPGTRYENNRSRAWHVGPDHRPPGTCVCVSCARAVCAPCRILFKSCTAETTAITSICGGGARVCRRCPHSPRGCSSRLTPASSCLRGAAARGRVSPKPSGIRAARARRSAHGRGQTQGEGERQEHGRDRWRDRGRERKKEKYHLLPGDCLTMLHIRLRLQAQSVVILAVGIHKDGVTPLVWNGRGPLKVILQR